MPARERYIGSHIAIAEQAAEKEKLPLYFLSGMLGLVGADEPLAYYDHVLTHREMPALIGVIARQLQRLDIGTVHLYVKTKPSWRTYLYALQLAGDEIGATIHIHELPDDA
jgi:hypothetical protein